MSYLNQVINKRDDHTTIYIARKHPNIIPVANSKILEAGRRLIKAVGNNIIDSIEILGVPINGNLEKDCIDEVKFYITEYLKFAKHPSNPAAIAQCELMLMKEVCGKIKVYIGDKLRKTNLVTEKQERLPLNDIKSQECMLNKQRVEVELSFADIKKWKFHINLLNDKTVKRRLSVLLMHNQKITRREIQKSYPTCNISRDIDMAKKHVKEMLEKHPALKNLS
jgi:hypothetical protein